MNLTVIFDKVFAYFSYISFGLVALIIVLLLTIIYRQKAIRRHMDRFSENMSNFLAKASEQRKAEGEAQIQKISESLMTLAPLFERMDGFEKNFEFIEKQMEFNQSGVQEMMMDLQSQEESESDKYVEDIDHIRERLDGIRDELAAAHQWLDELRILEKVVLNLIGPDKLRALLEQERQISARKVESSRTTSSTKKSLL